MTDPVWRAAPPPENVEESLRASRHPAWQVDLLGRRGVLSLPAAERFLNPNRDQLHPPELLPGIVEAAERLHAAAERKETVAIVGDYDADGISASALLSAVLKACRIDVQCILPSRLEEGYGFQPIHVERSLAAAASVIVTVDCGTTSYDGVRAAREAGLDVVITDHHQPGEPLAEGVIEVNPHRRRGEYPFLDLSGAGLALKLAQATAARCGRDVPLDALLRIACLGTIADLVPLHGENRVIAALGLDAMSDLRSLGLRALLEVSKTRPPIDAGDVGFRIGPRLNAAGRMGRAEPALRLLLTRDADEARQLAAELELANSQRRAEEAKVTSAALRLLEERGELPRVLIASHPDWHRGVLGIAASRIARQLHRPTILLQELDGVATGSGRSIRGVHLHALMAPSRGLLERFGGHAQAIGTTVRLDRIAELEAELLGRAAEWPDALLVPAIEYELDLRPEQIDGAFVAALDRLAPFGVGNRRPRVRVRALRLRGPHRVFGNGHLRAQVATAGEPLGLLGWGWEERSSDLSGEFEALGYLSIDRYDGRTVLELSDARPWRPETPTIED